MREENSSLSGGALRRTPKFQLIYWRENFAESQFSQIFGFPQKFNTEQLIETLVFYVAVSVHKFGGGILNRSQLSLNDTDLNWLI